MRDLIEALIILLKYGNPQWPTHCEHDVMMIMEIDPDNVSEGDKNRLAELGFHHGPHEANGDEPCFNSYRFGSA